MGFLQGVIADARSRPGVTAAVSPHGALAELVTGLSGAGRESAPDINQHSPAGNFSSGRRFETASGTADLHRPHALDFVTTPDHTGQPFLPAGPQPEIRATPSLFEISAPLSGNQEASQGGSFGWQQAEHAIEPDTEGRTAFAAPTPGENLEAESNWEESLAPGAEELRPSETQALAPGKTYSAEVPQEGRTPPEEPELASMDLNGSSTFSLRSAPILANPGLPSTEEAVGRSGGPVAGDIAVAMTENGFARVEKDKNQSHRAAIPRAAATPIPERTDNPILPPEENPAKERISALSTTSLPAASQNLPAVALPGLPDISAPTSQVRTVFHPRSESSPDCVRNPAQRPESATTQTVNHVEIVGSSLPARPPRPETRTPEVRIGQIDVFIEGPAHSGIFRSDSQRPSLGLASRYFLRRI